MNNRIRSLQFLGALLLACGILTLQLYAQQTSSPSSQQYPQQQPRQQPGDTPDQSAQQAPDSHPQPSVQVFTGTIVKSGDKYVLQDSAGGTTYDIDHQDQVKEHEGKKVRVHGILDADGKTIHVQ